MKCRPSTLSGRRVAAAMSVIASDEVLLARIACGGATASSSAKILRFRSRFSTTASMIRSQASSAWRSVVPMMRAAAASRSLAANLPLVTARSIELRIRAIPASISSRLTSRTITV